MAARAADAGTDAPGGGKSEPAAIDWSEENVASLLATLTPDQCLRLHALLLKRQVPWAVDAYIGYSVPGNSRESQIALPPMATPAADDDDPLADMTDRDKAVVQVVDEMRVGDVLSYDEIAVKAGYANTGKLRECVKRLAAAGRLKTDRFGWRRVK